MNSDKPLSPGEELEIRITALLMGELSSEEADALHARLAANPELQTLHARLANAFELLRSAVPLANPVEELTPVRLSNERREKLLRRFRATSATSPKVVPLPKRRWTWLAPLSWAASFTIAIGVLLWGMSRPAGMLLSRSSSEFEATAGGVAGNQSYRFQGGATDVFSTAPPESSATLGHRIPTPAAAARPLATAKPAAQPVEPALAAAGSKIDESNLKYDNTTNYAGMPYYRGRGIEETGKSFFEGAAPATASAGEFFQAPPATVAPAAPVSGTVVDESRMITANGAKSGREVPLNAWTESLAKRNKQLETELAEAKAVTESLKSESGDLKNSLGDVQRSMDQLKTAIPAGPILATTPSAGTLFSVQPSPETAARGEMPGGAPTTKVPALIASSKDSEVKQLADGTSDSDDISKGDKTAAPAKSRLDVKSAVGDLSQNRPMEARDKEIASAGQPEQLANGRGYTGKAMAGSAINPKPQEEAAAEKLAELNAGDQLGRLGGFGREAEMKEFDAKLKAEDSLSEKQVALKGMSEPQNGQELTTRSNLTFGSEAKPVDPSDNIGLNFTDGGIASGGQAGGGRKQVARRLLLDANGLADTGRLDLADKSYGEILAIDPLNDEAREGKERIASERDRYAAATFNESRSTQQDWYFKQDGTLAKLSKGKGVDTNTPAQQPAESALGLTPGKTVTLTKEVDAPVEPTKSVVPIPQPEVSTSANAFSTFSLNVSDVAFKLAAASLEQNKMPDPAAIRSEEFINAFDYRDPEPVAGAPLAFVSERARYPFAQNRDLLRLSIKTAAVGRQPGRPLNLVLLVDNSGSMERADRVQILRESLRVLAGQLQPMDKLSIITFARTPHLWVDGVSGSKAGEATQRVGEITPQGGTNLSAALDLAYETARRYYQATNINRVVLLTDGAANLGDVNPAALKQKVEDQRKKGIALDCFGIGWEGYNDDLLEQLSRNGDGRYGFINSPDAASTEFAGQLAGALRVAASDVKVQVEFNPKRVTAYRQIGYAKHQLTKEQFRDNTVDAAEIGAAESGNALYVVELNPRGEGDLATVRARFKVPGTSDYREHEWSVPFSPNVPALEQATPALRLAATASAFSESLAGSPYATEVTSDKLLGLINGVPQAFTADPRPQKLEWMIRQAKSLSGH